MQQLSFTSRISLGISLLILVLIGGLTTAALHYFEKQLQSTIFVQQQSLLTNLADEIDRHLQIDRELIEGLAQAATAEDFSSPAKAEQFIQRNPGLTELFRHGIQLYTPDGHQIAANNQHPDLPPSPLSAAILDSANKQHHAYIVPPFAIDQMSILMFITSVRNDKGSTIGLIAGTDYLHRDFFLGHLGNIRVGETGYVFLFDRQGTLLSHPDYVHRITSKTTKHQADLIALSLKGKEGTSLTDTALVSYKPLQQTEWIIAANYPLDEAYVLIYRARYLAIGGVLLIAILTLQVVWVLMRRLTSPLDQFTAQVHKVNRGEKDLLSLPESSPHELRALGEAFNRLLSDLQIRTRSLHEQQSLLESLLQSTAMACFAVDPDHRVLLWNRACEQLTGYSAKEMIGTCNHWQAFYPEQRPCLADLVLDPHDIDIGKYYDVSGISPLTPGGYQAEDWFSKLGGKDRYLLFNAVPVYRPNGELLAAIETIEDITELRRTHEQVNSTLSLLNATFESTADGLVVENLAGRIIRFNQRAAEMWQMQKPLAQSSDLHYLSRQLLDQLKEPEQFLRQVKEITENPGLDSFDVIDFKDGRSFERTSKPQLLNDKIIGRVWSYHDISEKKHLEQNLRHAQKMEAVGQLAGGIAHDFNNLLTVINGYAEVLLASLPEKSELQKYADLVLQAGLSAASLTSQLLAFSSRQLLKLQVLDLNELIRRNQKLLNHMLREDMLLTLELTEALPLIKADPNQIEQILINLTVNARDAMVSGGRLLIMTSKATLDDSFVEQNTGSAPGVYSRLTISDNGCGMSDEVLARVFEPFYSTKERSKGTGLGLATVYGIVKQSGGYITVDSAPNAGTSFNVYLPMSHSQQPTSVLAPVPIHQGSGRILLVENETDLRDLLVATLKKRGYHVVGVASAELALQQIELDTAFDLLLSDIVMAGMSGLQLAQQLCQQDPTLKVLLITGYSELGELGFEKELPFPVLLKPFLPDDLLRQIQTVMQPE